MPLLAAVITDEIAPDLHHACRVAREYGVQHLELRRVWDTPVEELTTNQIKDVQEILTGTSTSVCCLATGFGKCHAQDTPTVRRHLDNLRRAADTARELGCTLLRGFSYWRDSDRWDDVLRVYQQVPAILEAWEVSLGIENEPRTMAGNATELHALLGLVGYPRIRAVWDPANEERATQKRGSAATGLELLQGQVAHVHVKDVRRQDDEMKTVLLGTGTVDWKHQFELLRAQEFAGHVSLEAHLDPDQLPPRTRDEYPYHLQGSGREPATRVALHLLRQMLKEHE
jgi:sugar phosphate isomerase/epimerase